MDDYAHMIESIKIKVGDKTIELTLEEARGLKGELETLFAEPVVVPMPFTQPYWHKEKAGTL